jgi:hypothetical protein
MSEMQVKEVKYVDGRQISSTVNKLGNEKDTVLLSSKFGRRSWEVDDDQSSCARFNADGRIELHSSVHAH